MASGSRTKNSVYNIVSNGFQQGLNILLRFVVRTAFIYTLGPEYLGINGLFTSLLTMLSLAELGFDSAMNYRLYKPLAEGNVKRIRVLLKFYRLVYIAVGSVIFLIGLALIPALPYMISGYSKLDALGINAVLIFLLYLMQSVSSYLFFAYKSAIVKADQKTYLLNCASLVIDTISSLIQLAILILTHNFIAYTVVLVVFTIITNLVYAIIAKRRYPTFFLKEKENLPKDEIAGLFKDCGALFIFKADSAVMSAAGNIILSIFMGLATVGIYSNYLVIYESLKTLFVRLYGSVKASIGNMFATESVESQYLIFEVMNLITMFIYGTTGVTIACVANELIEVWLGLDYVLSQAFAILMGVELLLSGLKLNLNQIRNASGQFRQMWWRPLIGICINLAVSIVTVPLIGPSGVVLGIICAALIANLSVDPPLIHKYSFKGYKKVSYYYKKNILYVLVLGIVAVIDFEFCQLSLTYIPLADLIIHAAICIVSVPAALIVVFKSRPEMRYLFSKMSTLIKRNG